MKKSIKTNALKLIVAILTLSSCATKPAIEQLSTNPCQEAVDSYKAEDKIPEGPARPEVKDDSPKFIEGCVGLVIDINKEGKPENIRIVRAEPNSWDIRTIAIKKVKTYVYAGKVVATKNHKILLNFEKPE